MSANASHQTFNLTDTGTGGVIKADGFDLSNGAASNVSGDLVLNATAVATATVGVLNNLGNASGTISSTSTFLFTGTSGTNTAALTSNRSIGALAVGNGSNASILELSSNITAAGLLTVNSLGTLNLTDPTGTVSGTAGTYTLTVAGLSGAGTVTNNATGAVATTLTLNGSGTSVFSGVIADAGTGKALTVTLSSGTQILAGASTYVGPTNINGGTLIAENHTALGTGAGGVTVATGAALDYQAASNTTLTLGSGVLTITGGTTGATIGGSIGSTTTSAEIVTSGHGVVTGSGTGANGIKVNVYGVTGLTPAAGTYTLVAGGAGSTLNGAAAYSLGNVYNNTNFFVTAGSLAETAQAITVGVTVAGSPLTTAFWDAGGYSTAPAVMAAGNGSTASNWSILGSPLTAQGLIPGSTAAVTFGTNSTTAVTLGANMSIAGLTLADTSAHAFTLSADGNTLTLGTSGITVNSGVTTASTIAANVALGGNQTWTVNPTTAAKALTVSGVVSGTGNLTTAGSGITILSGNNTFTGTTTISAGTLQLSSTNALQNSIVTIGATNDLTFSGPSVYNVGGLSGSANESLQDNSGNGITLVVGNNNSTGMSYSGVLSGIGGLTKVGTGTQTLTTTNTYTGLLSLNGGILNTTAGAINASNLNEGIAFNGGTLQASGAISTAKPINLLGIGTVDTTGGNVTLSGNIIGLNATLTKSGTGTLTISGASNNFANLTINDGTVVDGTSSISALDTSAGLTIFANTGTPTIDLNGNSPTLASLSSTGSTVTGNVWNGVGGNGIITNNGPTASTLTLAGGSSRYWSGVIQDGNKPIALNIFMTQTGNLGQAFTNVNTYSGGTTISTAGFGGSLVTLFGQGSLGTGP